MLTHIYFYLHSISLLVRVLCETSHPIFHPYFEATFAVPHCHGHRTDLTSYSETFLLENSWDFCNLNEELWEKGVVDT